MPIALGLVLSAPVAPVELVEELVAPIVLLLLDVSGLLVREVELEPPGESVSDDVLLDGLAEEADPLLERPAVLLAGVEL